jgi:hypothetical protein
LEKAHNSKLELHAPAKLAAAILTGIAATDYDPEFDA